ncbi:MAG TPA: sialidase family protein, partial [Gaiellaceae bacterium]|nr:sialidase family protein [Gaiellaceae bacterium]
MRRVVLVLALVVVGPAAAATIHGSRPGQLIVGTQAPDRIFTGPGPEYVQVAWGGVDTVHCGTGTDVVTADRSDVVGRSCAIVSRRLSVDASLNPKSQHETAIEPDDAAFGSTVVAAYQVGRFQTGASSNIGFAVSNDAGLTWQRGELPSLTVESVPPGPESSASDPTVAYDAVHGTWLIGTLTLEANASHVLVARSPDGAHWAAPVSVATGPLLDKDWLVCDNGATSPHPGRCYATYTDDQKNITVVQSSDDGGVTWSQPVTMGPILVGTQPVVLADGAL